MSDRAEDAFDVGEFHGELNHCRRATDTSLNALREDFTDMSGRMARGFAEMQAKFDATAAGQKRIVDLLQTIIDDRD